jgi:hypothetical protein
MKYLDLKKLHNFLLLKFNKAKLIIACEFLTFIKQILRYIIIPSALIIAIYSFFGGSIFYNIKHLFFKETQIITATHINSKPIDSIFTSFIYINTTDLKKNDNKIIGLCSRTYEVSVGYKDVQSFIEKNRDASCNETFQSLPDPTILSINAVSAQIEGQYSQQECDTWDDASKTGLRPSLGAISMKLRREGRWPIIKENSQHILMSYINLYCKQI